MSVGVGQGLRAFERGGDHAGAPRHGSFDIAVSSPDLRTASAVNTPPAWETTPLPTTRRTARFMRRGAGSLPYTVTGSLDRGGVPSP